MVAVPWLGFPTMAKVNGPVPSGVGGVMLMVVFLVVDAEVGSATGSTICEPVPGVATAPRASLPLTVTAAVPLNDGLAVTGRVSTGKACPAVTGAEGVVVQVKSVPAVVQVQPVPDGRPLNDRPAGRVPVKVVRVTSSPPPVTDMVAVRDAVPPEVVEPPEATAIDKVGGDPTYRVTVAVAEVNEAASVSV